MLLQKIINLIAMYSYTQVNKGIKGVGRRLCKQGHFSLRDDFFKVLFHLLIAIEKPFALLEEYFKLIFKSEN